MNSLIKGYHITPYLLKLDAHLYGNFDLNEINQKYPIA
jgi:hypothetical protein